MTAAPTHEPTPDELESAARAADLRSPSTWLPDVMVTAAAFALALLIGAVIIALSDESVLKSLDYFFSYPWDFFTRSGSIIGRSYWALVTGSLGSGHAIGTTLERSAPLICAGLGVTLAFRVHKPGK